jgi:hypothetical protein
MKLVPALPVSGLEVSHNQIKQWLMEIDFDRNSSRPLEVASGEIVRIADGTELINTAQYL